jgi:hypothetical protein
METLVVQLIKRYRQEIKDSQNEAEREILYKVVRDLEKMAYSYKPSATYALTDWRNKDKEV